MARHENYLQKILARYEKFCWTNFNKIRRFLLKQVEFGSNCAVDKHTKISVDIRISADIQKVKYRKIILVDRYIGRSLTGTDDISLYKSWFLPNFFFKPKQIKPILTSYFDDGIKLIL